MKGKPAKIEIFGSWMIRHVNWQKVMDDFLPIWDCIVIERDSNGSVAVKCYGSEAKATKEGTPNLKSALGEPK